MEENEQLDVAPESETGDGSSAVEETPVEETPSEQVLADGTPQAEKTVPYDRFAEVNQQLAEIKQSLTEQRQPANQQPQTPSDPVVKMQEEQAKQQLAGLLKEMGFVSQEELQRQQQDQQLNQEIQRLENTYSGKDGRPKFAGKDVVKYAVDKGFSNLEAAYRDMHYNDLINWHVKQAVQGSKGLKTEGSDGSGSANAGTTTDDLRQAIANNPSDKAALHTLLKRTVSKG